MVLTATEKLKVLATGKATLKEINELEKQAETEGNNNAGTPDNVTGATSTKGASGETNPGEKGTGETTPEVNPEIEDYKRQLAEKDAQLAEKDAQLKQAQLDAQHADNSDQTDYSDAALLNIFKGIR